MKMAATFTFIKLLDQTNVLNKLLNLMGQQFKIILWVSHFRWMDGWTWVVQDSWLLMNTSSMATNIMVVWQKAPCRIKNLIAQIARNYLKDELCLASLTFLN